MVGGIRPDAEDAAARFEVPDEELREVTTDMFTSSQVWAQGVTDAVGQGPGILAQVGYGPDGSQPTDPGWSWFAMSYNVDAGNNDEYSATFVPTQVGTFDYATRYSGDGGATWNVADLNGPQLDNILDNPGSLTVVPEPGATALVAAALGLLSLRCRRDAR